VCSINDMKTLNTKLPLYHQLKQVILQWIEEENYPVDKCLPSEKELQELFHVSRTTVRLALKELETDGMIVRYPGRGTFVSGKKMIMSARRLNGFTSEMQNYGFKPNSQIISFQKETLSANKQKLLNMGPDEQAWVISRLRFADAIPIATETAFLPVRYAPDLEDKYLRKGSLYQYLYKKCNIKIVNAQERVEAKLPDATEMKQLKLSYNSPVFYVERLTKGLLKGELETISLERTTYNAAKYVLEYTIGGVDEQGQRFHGSEEHLD
jgi:GntR family transcriptional regulator